MDELEYSLTESKSHSKLEINKNYIQDLFHDFIAQNLSSPQNKIIDCLDEGEESFTLVPIDNRLIIEARCGGVMNIFYCHATQELVNELKQGDSVIINCEDVTEMATIKELGKIVEVKRQRLGLSGEYLPKLIRKANSEDLLIQKKNIENEETAKESFKVKSLKYSLAMKLVEVHFQFDRNKLFFFYTADGRIDFRELAKDLASEFRTRIELRQIGVRDEAKRVGGIGICGREFCCSLFLCNFKRITTQLATDQNIAPNFSKLSGPCGKLKCCLSFEIEYNYLNQ
ncbi:MAG: regulatory iron-sulfur-containing complex subunit RicT [Ignavibacteriales bacterium]|nr:regulatory iron-sulfur-containing complex subunit RicT [Ignavibacteriales bacterium]